MYGRFDGSRLPLVRQKEDGGPKKGPPMLIYFGLLAVSGVVSFLSLFDFVCFVFFDFFFAVGEPLISAPLPWPVPVPATLPVPGWPVSPLLV